MFAVSSNVNRSFCWCSAFVVVARPYAGMLLSLQLPNVYVLYVHIRRLMIEQQQCYLWSKPESAVVVLEVDVRLQQHAACLSWHSVNRSLHRNYRLVHCCADWTVYLHEYDARYLVCMSSCLL